jgi:stage II sporulation protein M
VVGSKIKIIIETGFPGPCGLAFNALICNPLNRIQNGLILGWIVVTATGPSLVDAAGILVPHGMFEWPAMMIAWGVGLWRGALYRFGTDPGTFVLRWQQSNRVFSLIVLPLLLLAAMVEGRGHLF